MELKKECYKIQYNWRQERIGEVYGANYNVCEVGFEGVTKIERVAWMIMNPGDKIEIVPEYHVVHFEDGKVMFVYNINLALFKKHLTNNNENNNVK